MTLITRPPGWLGGGVHVQQMIDTIEQGVVDGDTVLRVGSVRGGAADLRLPTSVLTRLGPRTARAVGKALWGGRSVHRVSIDLPPSPDEVISLLDLAPRRFPDEGSLPKNLRDQVRRCRGVLVSTTLIADEVRHEFGDVDAWLVPPAVDRRFFEAIPSTSGGGPPFVLHVGGATRRKGLDHLAAAWRLVTAVEPELRLVMVGPQHASGRAGLLDQERVKWLGMVSDTEVLALMSEARAVVVPSVYEGFGMPVAEAMALGTPVVVHAETAPAEVGGDVAFAAGIEAGPDAMAGALVDAAHARDDAQQRLLAGKERAQLWTSDRVSAMQQAAYSSAFA